MNCNEVFLQLLGMNNNLTYICSYIPRENITVLRLLIIDIFVKLNYNPLNCILHIIIYILYH